MFPRRHLLGRKIIVATGLVAADLAAGAGELFLPC
jgi:hypothetical protein